MTDDGGTTGPRAKRPGIRPWRRQGARRAPREPDPLSLRGREDRVVRWIGASRRRKAAVPKTAPEPEPGSNVIVLAHAEIYRLDRRPRFPAAPARGSGRGAIVATLLPFVPRANAPVQPRA